MRQLPAGDPRSEITRNVRPQYIDYGSPEPDEDSSGGLLEYWRILNRHKGTIIVIACLGLLVSVLVTLPQTPVYQARTIIEVQGLNEDFMNMRNVNPTSNANSYYPEYDIQTQVQLLQDDTLLERVSQKVAAQNKPLPGHQTRVSAWRKLLGLTSPATEPASSIQMAAGTLKVRAQANTRLIEIRCDSAEPEIAAAFINQLTSEFTDQNLDARWKSTQHTGEWLARQMQDVKVNLEKSEELLQEYARQTGLVFTQEKENVTEQKLKQVQDELSRAQADRFMKQARYELATRASVESLAEVLDDASLTDIQAKLTDLRRQHAELSSTYTPDHRQVRKVQAQITALENTLGSERAKIIGRIQSDFESAQRREKLLAAEYAGHRTLMTNQADKVAHYNILKRDVDTNRQIYDNMLQRVKEAGIASALRASNVRVVAPAKAPKLPYKPSLAKNAALGLFGGVFLGVVFVMFRERADRTIQEPGEATMYLGVPELGTVPSASADRRRGRDLMPRAKGDRQGFELITLESKSSLMAEAYRATLTSILFAGKNGKPPRVLMVSSAAPAEGKTTLCTNLAIAMAEIHQRVLVIDADMRKPRMHGIFNLDNKEGFVNLLRRAEPIVALNGEVRMTHIANLSVIPSGAAGEGEQTLLHSRRLGELIAVARQEYDMVLIDTPPMLTMSDGRVIAGHADAVLLVARVNQTSRDALREAYHRFIEDGAPVLGTVLNDWNPKHSGKYGYSDAYAYRRKDPV